MHSQEDHQALLDMIYETSVDSGAWPALLDRFASILGGHAAAFRSYNVPAEVGTVVATRIDATELDSRFRHFADRNPLKSSLDYLARVIRGDIQSDWKPGLKRDVDWLPKDEFVRTAYYNDFYRAYDIHSDLSIGLTSVGGHWTGFDIYRPKCHGPFSDDDLALCHSVLPHLVRARKLGERLADRRDIGEGLWEVLDRSPHGLFLLEQNGRVRYVNEAGQRLMREAGGLSVVGGRLVASAPSSAQRLQQLIHAAGSRSGVRTGGTLAIARPERFLPLSVVIAPLGADSAAGAVAAPSVVVSVTDLEAGLGLPEQRLRDLFSLTVAEAHVAMRLFEGFDPRQAAAQLDVSLPTVRTHMARIFEKTGTSGQVELARLMMRTVYSAPVV